MSNSHANWLRRAAEEIAKVGHYGWGNTCEGAAEHIDALEAELAALRIENDALRDELQKVRRAAISGMDAATQHGRGLVQQAAKLRAESNPDALESERAMNAALTEQLERAEAAAAGLRANAERYRELRRLATAWPQTVLVVNINIGHDWRTADAPEEIDSVVDAAIDATLTQEDHND